MPRYPATGEASRLPQTVELGVKDPRGDKGLTIAFQAGTREECAAYKRAIIGVLKEKGISHQHNPAIQGDENTPGYHEWEIQYTAKERLEELLPEIDRRAKRALGR